MPIIQLRHFKKLGYAATTKRSLPTLPLDIGTTAKTAAVITFRPMASGRPDQVRKDMHACVRLTDLPDTDLVFYGIQTDSPLAPLLIWDAAHQLAVGRAVTFLGDFAESTYLEREYFRGSFVVERKDAQGAVLRKIAMLPVEKEAGLDRWTFGIPVGPDDATLLNVTVKRILELDVPEKEIVLCGRPGANFKYWDKVRIVGEDITAPPVKICAKKNRLAQEAKYENLCIIHDRVFLPYRFYSAVKKFGDHFPLTAFQSIFFDDLYNLVPRRYSDFGTAPKVAAQATLGLMRDNDTSKANPYAPTVFPITEGAGFFAGNALRHSESHYPTGSLYLCKRSVWLQCPQDETLFWTEFEDLEQANRAAKMGIPSRVNPHGFTQSLISRPLLSLAGATHYEMLNGGFKPYRAPLEALPLPRKPLIKMTESQGQQNLIRFAHKYVPSHVALPISAGSTLTSRVRLKTIIQILHAVRVPFRNNAIRTMLNDYEKLLVGDQLPYAWVESAVDRCLIQGDDIKKFLAGSDSQFLNQISQRPDRSIFAKSLTDYLPRRSISLYFGSLLSAIVITLLKRKLFFFEAGFISLYRDIIQNTPFKNYASEES